MIHFFWGGGGGGGGASYGILKVVFCNMMHRAQVFVEAYKQR